MLNIRKLKIPAAGRNIDYKYKNTNSTSSSISGGGSILLPNWLSFVEYNPENETIKFNKHLISEGEIAAYQSGEFNTNIFDNIPTGSKTNKGLLQVGNGINVNSSGVISLDSSAVTQQTLSFSNNVLSISNGNSVDLSTLQTDLSNYYNKGETDTLLNGKANTSHTHIISNVTGLQTALDSKVNNTLFDSLFELKTDSLGTQYIQAKHSLLSVGEISAYKTDETSVGSLFDNLPKASTTDFGIVKIGNGLTVSNGVIGVDGDIFNLSNYYNKTQTDTLLNSKANTSHTHLISDITNLQSSLDAKALKAGSSTQNFTVKDLYIHGTVNHWLADVITVDDAKLQLNRTQNSATVVSGLDIFNGTNVVSSLNYTIAGNWQFTQGEIFQGAHRVALQNVSINAGNGLSGGGAISASRTITLGTPSTITNSTTNSVSSTSHTHKLDISHIPSKGNLDAETLRNVRDTGLYTYGMYSSNSGHPNGSSYGSVINWGRGTGGSVQLYGGWASTSKNRLWVRSLRDTTDNWTDWSGIYSDNYHPNADNATKLGGYSAASYPRKAEAAVITGAWEYTHFIQAGGYRLGAGHESWADVSIRMAASRSVHIVSAGSGNNGFLRLDSANGINQFRVQENGFVGFGIVPTERLHVAGNGLFTGDVKLPTGNVDIGTRNGDGLRFRNSDSFKIYFSQSNNATLGGNLAGTADYNMYFRTSGGNRGWAFKYNDNIVAQIQGNGSFSVTGSVTTGSDLYVGGNVTATGEVTAYSSSDKRLKKNIKTIESAIDIINKLNPIQFNWNEKAVKLNDVKNTKSINYGVIAQEIEEVLPDLVHQTNGFKSVDYIQLIGVLLGAVKELNNEIKELKNRL